MGKEFSLEDYVVLLIKDVELPPEDVETLKRVLAHEKVAPRVKDTVLMRSEFSRKMDELTAKEKETEEFYNRQLVADHNNRELYERNQAELARYKELASNASTGYGDDDDANAQARLNGDYVTKVDYEKGMLESQRNSLKYMNTALKLSHRHFREFSEDLDPDALVEFALKNQIPLEVAYDRFTEDHREKKRQEEMDRIRKESHDEGYKEALSKHQIPILDNRPRGIHALNPPKDVTSSDSRERVDKAVEAYLRGS